MCFHRTPRLPLSLVLLLAHSYLNSHERILLYVGMQAWDIRKNEIERIGAGDRASMLAFGASRRFCATGQIWHGPENHSLASQNTRKPTYTRRDTVAAYHKVDHLLRSSSLQRNIASDCEER